MDNAENFPKLADAEHRPLAAWLDEAPAWANFGNDDPQAWTRFVMTLMSNLPDKTTMAASTYNKSMWHFELRGRALTKNPGPYDYSYRTYSEVLPHESRIHMGRVDVHPLYEKNGIGGAMFASHVAAGCEAGLEQATFTAAEDGIMAWRPYKPDLNWGTMAMDEFQQKMLSALRGAKRMDDYLRDDLMERTERNDTDLLWHILEHEELQGITGKKGRTQAEELLKKAGSWSGVVELDGPSLYRVFDYVDERAKAGKQRYVIWRPAPQAADAAKVRRYG